jgi:hypothetical protein
MAGARIVFVLAMKYTCDFWIILSLSSLGTSFWPRIGRTMCVVVFTLDEKEIKIPAKLPKAFQVCDKANIVADHTEFPYILRRSRII